MALSELDGLIVDHLADIDRAIIRVNLIETAVFTALGERAEQWAKKQGWIADFSYPEGGWGDWSRWIAPPEWRTADTDPHGDEFDGWFHLDVGAGDTEADIQTEDWFYLTRLCRVGVGQLGLRFCVSGIKPKPLRKAFPSMAEFASSTGFIADPKPSLFLPFAIEPSVLATALRDEEPNAALEPFEAALGTLLGAKSAFDRILQHLKTPGE